MDKQNLFSIGDVAKLFHLSVSSLRHYEDVGLITPEYTDPNSGYRYYGARQFEVLNSIRYLRALDMPLSEIADFLGNRDVERIEEKLLSQKKAVIAKQEELKEQI
ncbi:MAG: helix-turn-helix domain-containing protein [Eubacteriales bacterium]|nr:helix-turn-helix domain-containing protein [Eubacteriales bacterium]